MQPTCVLLMPYFGAWPEGLEFYLDGCRRNPQFSFVFITDGEPVPAPPNVRFVKSTLRAVRERASEVLGMAVALENAYKLCDLRPAYGLVFAEYVRGYEFWGFGDIDCIYGNLGRYATPEVLSRVDVFCCRKEYVSGVFSLVRNSELMNRLFMRSRDWERVLSSSQYNGFEECGKAWRALIEGKDIKSCVTEVESFTSVVFDAIESGEVRGFFETVAVEDIHAETHLSSGGVIQNYTGWMLVHFVVAKSRWFFNFPTWRAVPERYVITRRGFWREGENSAVRRMAAWPWRKAVKSLLVKVRRKVRRKLGYK